MKKTIYYIFLLTGVVFLGSCEKDFLQRNPETEISPEVFFKTTKDLETYSNTFYGADYNYEDLNSDNISSYSGAGELDLLMEGGLDANTVGSSGWNDWSNLRKYNFLLDNVYKASGDPAEINHYIGIARYFRARFYFSKLARYSDVPWYSNVLKNTDTALYAPRSPRAIVADSILADLNFAVENIKPAQGNKTRVTKWTALALLSRFSLYEGTFRKYHPELGLTASANQFLEACVTASETLMANTDFQIYNTGNGAKDYRDLFISTALANNPEIIQWYDCQRDLGIGNNSHTVLGWTWSLSNSLVETYLMKDGTPFTSQPGYHQENFIQVFENRDPRLAETVAYPGYSPTNDDKYYISKPNLGGYDQLKFYPRDPELRQGWNANYNSLPIYRLAEVLLNFAEAKAELGSLSQSDIDLSIKKLRDRVQMPNLDLAVANANPDSYLATRYSTVSGSNKGVLLEIRRERRVELACEGLRLLDINRWAAESCLVAAQQGMYVPGLGAMDMTGDGVEDIAILANPNDTAVLNGLPADLKQNLARYYLKDASGKDNNFYLDGNTSGHISFTRYRDNPRNFEAPKYYYRPVPLSETVLNPQLEQIFGW